MPYLIYERDNVEQHHQLTEPETSIGRGHDATIRFRHDGKMSSHHCVVRKHAGGFTLVDKGSTNGTHVNGKRIRSAEVPLKDGDRIRVGKQQFRFCETIDTAPGPSLLAKILGIFSRRG